MKEKKKFELSATEISLILYALAVVIVVISYFTVFNPKMTEAKNIEAQNAGLQQTVSGLESMVAREAEVIAETAAYRQEVQDIISKYPVDVPTEKVIRIIQDMQDINEVDVSDIAVGVGNLVGSVSNVSVSDISASSSETNEEGEEGETAEAPATVAPATTGIGYYTLVNITYSSSYESFKKMVYYISTLSDRTTIPVISCASDPTTGMVSGTASFKLFYLTGTGKSYVAPTFDNQVKGVENIFGMTQGIETDGSENKGAEETLSEETSSDVTE